MENPDINRNLNVTITFSCIKTRTKTFFIQNKIIENFPFLNTLIYPTDRRPFFI